MVKTIIVSVSKSSTNTIWISLQKLYKMHIKTFIHIVKQRLGINYSGIKFGFYVPKRNRYVHMSLNHPLLSLECYSEIISDIAKFLEEKGQHDRFRFVYPRFIHSTKWKFDYKIFEKEH